MLYVTTRTQTDAFTVANTLQTSVARDGGRYVPRQLHLFSAEEMTAWLKKPFGQSVADLLNLFFSTKLSGWAVEFALGRSPLKLASMNHRLVVAELWHNPNQNYRYMVDAMHHLVAGDSEPTDWSRIAVGISILFGVFGQMRQSGMLMTEEQVDVAVNTGDFTFPMVAWYAREMGLPIGNIVCTCNENSAVWELLRQGNLPVKSAVHTDLPEVDVAIPANLERLIFATIGKDEVLAYAKAVENKRAYTVDEALLPELNAGISVSVVGSSRVGATIHKVYRTNQYILNPYTALTFAGLQDHRASTGEGRKALLLAERSPLRSKEAVSQALGITELALNSLV